MDLFSHLGILLGSSWGSGINLYLTTALLGIAGRAGWIELPGNLDFVTAWPVIIIALVLYLIEFLADKIPLVDSTWDAVHTFIRPAGGAALAYMATAGVGPEVQVPVSLLSGAISLDSHLTKATARAAINTSPEPITNSVASLTEDVSVVGVLWLAIHYPMIAAVLVVLFIIFSIWFLKVMFRFVKKIFQRKKENEVSR